jgi:hypothetical protein
MDGEPVMSAAIAAPGPCKRLLIVTYHVPPSGAVAALRMVGWARHLPACGWGVGFVAPPTVPDEPLDETLLRRLPPETAIFPVPYPQSYPVRQLRRFVHHAVWLPRALPALRRAVRDFQPDAVLTSGPPHCVHALGLWLKRKTGLPWVADFRDPFWSGIRYPPSWFPWSRWERIWERRYLRAADVVLANTPRSCAALQDAHPGLHHKVTFLTNGFDPECFPSMEAPVNARFTLLHAGELYAGRDPRPLLDALATLDRTRPPEEPPWRFVLLGRTTEGSLDLEAAIRERGLEHVVEIGGHVPYGEALEAMTRADLLVLVHTHGRKISIPAKLFEYFGAARPILALTDGDSDTAWALAASGLPHRVVPPLDATAIATALTELRSARPTAPDQARLAGFTRARLAIALAAYLDTIVATRRTFPRHHQRPCGPGAAGKTA